DLLLRLPQCIIRQDWLAILAHASGPGSVGLEEGIGGREHLVGQPKGMHLLHPFREFRIWPCFYPGLNKGAIEAGIYFRDARDRCELALVLYCVAAERPNVVERSRFEVNQIVAANEVVVTCATRFLLRHHRFVEAWRQYVDEINVARKFVVLLLGHRAG